MLIGLLCAPIQIWQERLRMSGETFRISGTSPEPTDPPGPHKSTASWILSVCAVLALCMLGWVTFGSAWFWNGQAQICSYSGRVYARPNTPCYRPPPPGCGQPSINSSINGVVQNIIGCITDDYPESVHRFHCLRDLGLIDCAFARLEDTVVPAWNDFALPADNRKHIAWAVGAVLIWALGKLGSDIWEYLKEQHNGR